MGLKYPVQCSGGSNPIMVHGSCVFLTFDKTNFNFFSVSDMLLLSNWN